MNFYGIFYNILFKILGVYWHVFSPQTAGVRVMIINNGKVLLVKHSYRDGYYFPGGGIKKKEHLVDGAIREVFEETGIRVKNLKLHGVYRKDNHSDTKLVYFTDTIDGGDKIKIDNKEIIHAEWFDLENLPYDIAPGIKRRIHEYLNNEDTSHGKWL